MKPWSDIFEHVCIDVPIGSLSCYDVYAAIFVHCTGGGSVVQDWRALRIVRRHKVVQAAVEIFLSLS